MKRKSRAVVSDSTLLIYLAKIGRLNLIKEVFGKVYIPDAVFDETVTAGKRLKMTDASIIERVIGEWIIKESVKPEVNMEYRFLDDNVRLGRGEKEALKLCKQLNAEYFIADDREARRISKILNIKSIGTCGLIIQAWRKGSITRREVLQILDELAKAGFRIGPRVYLRILKELGISP